MKLVLLFWSLVVVWSLELDSKLQKQPYTPQPDQPTQRVPACVNGLQATIYVAFEQSNVTGLAEYKKMMMDFSSLFPTSFALTAGAITPNRNNCNIDTNSPIFQGKTALSGWVFGDSSVGVADNAQPQFCQPNFDRLNLSIQAMRPRGATPDWDWIGPTLAYYMTRPCICDRRNDTNTEKIILWLPLTEGTSEYDVTSLTDSTYQHYVVPMGFDTVTENSGTVYDKLLRSNVYKKYTADYSSRLIPRGNTASQMVQNVWTYLCRNAGLISDDAAAAPPPILQKAEKFN